MKRVEAVDVLKRKAKKNLIDSEETWRMVKQLSASKQKLFSRGRPRRT
jgi:hypothetical protein